MQPHLTSATAVFYFDAVYQPSPDCRPTPAPMPLDIAQHPPVRGMEAEEEQHKAKKPLRRCLLNCQGIGKNARLYGNHQLLWCDRSTQHG